MSYLYVFQFAIEDSLKYHKIYILQIKDPEDIAWIWSTEGLIEKMAKTPALEVSNINPKVLEAEYAVRGAIAVKSQKYAECLADGAALDFPKIVQCNIGAFATNI